MNLRLSCIPLYFLFLAGSPLHGQWTNLHGPEGGQIKCFASSDSVLLAGTEEGGIYRSTDDGTTWCSGNDGFTNGHVYSMAAKGTDVFAAVGEDIFRSTDAGITWKQFNPDEPVYPESFVFQGSMVYAVRSWHGIFRSPIKKRHWEKLDGISMRTDSHAMFADADLLLAADTRGRIFRSTDDGNHWMNCEFPGVPPSADIRKFFRTDSFIFAENDHELFRSRNGRFPWEKTSKPPGFGLMYGALGSNLLSASFSNDFSYSTDEGTIWKKLPVAGNVTHVRAICIHHGMVFAGTDDGIYRSSDTGATWSQCNRGLYCSSMSSVASNQGTIFTAGSGGVFRSTDGGLQWEAAIVKKNDIGFVAAEGHAVYASFYNNQSFYRSTDDGATWHSLHISFNPTPDFNAFCHRAAHLFTMSPGGIFTSFDTGTTWKNCFPASWGNRQCRMEINGIEIVAGVDSLGYFRSPDTGKHWITVEPGDLVNKYLSSVAIHDNKIFAILVGRRGREQEFPPYELYRTDDDGKQWHKVSSDKKLLRELGVLVAHGRYLFGYGSRSLYLSDDDGTHWKDVTDGLLSEVSSISFDADRVIVATRGGGLWMRALKELEH